jgi:hypothetical protein
MYDGYLMGIADLSEGDGDLSELVRARADDAEALERLESSGGGEGQRDASKTAPSARRKAPPVSLATREIRDYCGWVSFEDAAGVPTRIAMFLTRDEVKSLEDAADSDARLTKASVPHLAASPQVGPVIRRCLSALERGLRGRVGRFPEDPAAARTLVEEIRGLCENSLDAGDSASPAAFGELIRRRAVALGLSEDQARHLCERYLSSPESFGGMLQLSQGGEPRLMLIRHGVVECLRRAMHSRHADPYSFDRVLDWLDEAVRLEPDLVMHYRQLVRAVRSASALEDVCIPAA